MTIRSILIGASGGAASDGALELGCHLASRFHARVEAFHGGVDAAGLALAAQTGAVPLDKRWAAEVASAATTLEGRTRVSFAKIAARHGLSPGGAVPSEPGAWWSSAVGDGPRLLARYARFFDLVVLGRSRRVVEEAHSGAVEETLLQSGRPVLLAPEKPPQVIGETIAVGWNGSAQAVRALVAALPLLEKARKVVVITITKEPDQSANPLGDYLTLHNINAEFRDAFLVERADLGGQLLSTARDVGADLLIMGGYGRSPWREYLFGGTTREIVGVSLLPLFLAN